MDEVPHVEMHFGQTHEIAHQCILAGAKKRKASCRLGSGSDGDMAQASGRTGHQASPRSSTRKFRCTPGSK